MVLSAAVAVLNHFPLYILMVYLTDHRQLPGGVHVERVCVSRSLSPTQASLWRRLRDWWIPRPPLPPADSPHDSGAAAAGGGGGGTSSPIQRTPCRTPPLSVTPFSDCHSCCPKAIARGSSATFSKVTSPRHCSAAPACCSWLCPDVTHTLQAMRFVCR